MLCRFVNSCLGWVIVGCVRNLSGFLVNCWLIGASSVAIS